VVAGGLTLAGGAVVGVGGTVVVVVVVVVVEVVVVGAAVVVVEEAEEEECARAAPTESCVCAAGAPQAASRARSRVAAVAANLFLRRPTRTPYNGFRMTTALSS
jgi:hypothetical protein